MTAAHITLQGKGGCGKSLIAALLCQYLGDRGRKVLAFDADPVNATLSGYRTMAAERRHVDLLSDSRIKERNFDNLIEDILGAPDVSVVDTGSSCFIPLSAYIVETSALDVLAENGCSVTVHTVVVGGPALTDTLSGLESLATQLPDTVGIVVWVNAWFGPVVSSTGVPFEETKVYQRNQGRLAGLVQLRDRSDLHREDMDMLLQRRLTFSQADDDPAVPLMCRRRLQQTRDAIWTQLDGLFGNAIDG